MSLRRGGVGDIGGIILSDGQQVYAGLHNSFTPQRDARKKKYLYIAMGIVLAAEFITYIAVSWQGEAREIPFSTMSIDLGEFKPRARRAPVIEVDEVFGNQYVKEKKADATVVPANEAGGSIDGEDVLDLDVEAGAGGGAGAGGPDIGRCAVRNFPSQAKAYVEEAVVPIEILVDKTGVVRKVKTFKVVIFKKNLPAELKGKLSSMFLDAAVASLQGRRCRPIYRSGVAMGYKMMIDLTYELSF